MESQLSILIGRDIVSAQTDPGQWGLFFGDATLNINNPVRVLGVSQGDLPSALRGLTLERVVECKTCVAMHFTGGVTLEVDLRDEAYTGPEAMLLIRPDGGFVVWN